MRPERADLNRKIHGDGGGVPPRSSQPLEDRILGGRLVQVERLRIEFGRKALDVFPGDGHLTAFEAHPQLQVVEPLDHCVFSSWLAEEDRNELQYSPQI